MSEHSVSFIERRLAYDIDKVKNPFKKGGKKKTEKKWRLCSVVKISLRVSVNKIKRYVKATRLFQAFIIGLVSRRVCMTSKYEKAWAEVTSIELTFLTLLVSWKADHFLLTKPNNRRNKEGDWWHLCFRKKSPVSQPRQCQNTCSYYLPFVVSKLLRDFGQVLRLSFWEEEKMIFFSHKITHTLSTLCEGLT